MIDPDRLVGDLRRLTRVIGEGLRGQVDAGSGNTGALRRAYDQQLANMSTDLTWDEWKATRADELAAMWAVATAIVRYCEDNRLFHCNRSGVVTDAEWDDKPNGSLRNRIACEDPALGWARQAAADLGAIGVTGRSVDPGEVLFRDVALPHEVAADVVAFWRRRADDGSLVHDFTDPTLKPDWLRAVYANISDNLRSTYALIPTPDLVIDLVLDLTVDPALEQFGSDGFRVIDPACGSGEFLLRVVQRMARRSAVLSPGSDGQSACRESRADTVASGLAGVHGMDRSPVATMITRFRLLMMAMRAIDARALDASAMAAITSRIITGDALLGTPAAETGPDRVMMDGSYDAVVCNPPYVTVRDGAIQDLYRDRFTYCTGHFPLTVPYAELSYRLARRGTTSGEAGFVGQLAAGSFAKREFGRRLVEEFYGRQVSITDVIDTSGAYIPGHGTPTMVIAGRNVEPLLKDPVRVVTSKRGEPDRPTDPQGGKVWQSILQRVQNPGSEDDWAESFTIRREELGKFPWSLAPSIAAGIVGRMAGKRKLADIARRVGYLTSTGADDVFLAQDRSQLRRSRVETEMSRRVVSGHEVRDWMAVGTRLGLYPLVKGTSGVSPESADGGHHEQLPPGLYCYLWPFRTVLGTRTGFAGQSYFDEGKNWHEWHQVASDIQSSNEKIVWAWVSTHNHFALLGDAIAVSSAPVVVMGEDVSYGETLGLLGVLNSSAVAFWLKLQCNRKGWSEVGMTGRGVEPWQDRYEFTGSHLRNLPVPDTLPVALGARLVELAQSLDLASPAKLISGGGFDADQLAQARARWTTVKRRMVALQEELDWQIYRSYGLVDDASLWSNDWASVPEIEPGQRAFEIVHARRMAGGQSPSTSWFSRHGMVPVVEPPQEWPSDYRQLVERRMAAIDRDPQLGFLEQPTYKRPWAGPDWGTLQREALRAWLLERCEATPLWYSQPPNGDTRQRPRARSMAELTADLASDEGVREAAALCAPDSGAEELLANLISARTVPGASVMRYRASGLQKFETWTETWRTQRAEDRARSTGDEAAGDRLRRETLVPPRYRSADFLRPTYWACRGKFDVPREAFTQYGRVTGADGAQWLGWAGWSHVERVEAISGLAAECLERGDAEATLVPILCALNEALPWATQWAESDEEGVVQAGRDVLDRCLVRLGRSIDEVAQWRPPPPKRGRPRKSPPS